LHHLSLTGLALHGGYFSCGSFVQARAHSLRRPRQLHRVEKARLCRQPTRMRW
jgi:hypothetical protein